MEIFTCNDYIKRVKPVTQSKRKKKLELVTNRKFTRKEIQVIHQCAHKQQILISQLNKQIRELEECFYLSERAKLKKKKKGNIWHGTGRGERVPLRTVDWDKIINTYNFYLFHAMYRNLSCTKYIQKYTLQPCF